MLRKEKLKELPRIGLSPGLHGLKKLPNKTKGISDE